MSLPLTPAGPPWGPPDEVVVHDRVALDAPAIGHKLFFGHLVVHEQHISIATARRVQRLAGAQRNHLHIQAAGLLELGSRCENSPDCSVEVVDAIVMDCADTAPDATKA
jgi:hypothetical protein